MQLIRLRWMDLFQKDDMRDYDLVCTLCNIDYFAENWFRFLVNWNPTSLLQINYEGYVPLDEGAERSSIQRFWTVFEYGVQHYPQKNGISLLFKKDDNGETPLQIASERFERDKVAKVIEDTLAQISATTTQINISDVLMLAAINANIHVDCAYFFFLRRELHVLFRLLSRLINNSNSGNGGGVQVNNVEDDNDNDTIADDDNNNDEDNDDGNLNYDKDTDGIKDNKNQKRQHDYN